MNYIYDILLNFNKEFYDFYEWNNEDEIIHIRKIPIYKISNQDFLKIKNNLVQFNKTFLTQIYNKTEKFKKSKTKTLNYVFLISTGKETIGIKLNKNGTNIYKSSLLIDEEDEVSNIAENLETKKIEYKNIKTIKNEIFLTRKEKEIKKNLIKKLNDTYIKKDLEKLKYLYLECFNKQEENIDIIFNKLKKETVKSSKNTKKINDFFKLIEKQR